MILVTAYCAFKDLENLMQGTEMILSVSVKDEGIGMTPEQVSTAFQPFSQSSRHVRGNGIGLSICKNICEQLGGKIKVFSEVGVGTLFTFQMRAYND